MSVKQIIDTCLKGWEPGDGALSLSVTADSICYDDPNTGHITRDEFVEFVEDFKRAVIAMGGAVDANLFLRYSDVVIKDDELPTKILKGP